MRPPINNPTSAPDVTELTEDVAGGLHQRIVSAREQEEAEIKAAWDRVLELTDHVIDSGRKHRVLRLEVMQCVRIACDLERKYGR